MELFIPTGSIAEQYLDLDKEYFATGAKPTIYIENGTYDQTSEEAQYTLLEFFDKLERSYLCEESWFR